MFSRTPVRAVALLFLAAGLATSALGQCPDGTAPPCPVPPRAPADPRSVAVLYFRNETGDTANTSLADGLTETVTSRLTQFARLKVKSGAAVLRYRGRPLVNPAAMGRQLGVASLVAGILRRVGERLRITIELVRASNGRALWSQQYVRSGDDLLGIEGDVVRGIVGRLDPREADSLAPPGPTTVGPAYNHFLRGNAFLAQRTLAATAGAIKEYQEAARFDTAFSEAFARIALAYEFILDWGWPYLGLPAESLLARGEAAAERAMLLNPVSSDAWMAHGLLLAKRAPRSYEGAIPALERAIERNPRNAEAQHQLGTLYWQLGRDSAAIPASERALAIEPGRAITFFQLTLVNWTSRRPAQARRWLDSALAADPTFAYAYAFRSWFRAQGGDLSGAREDAEAAVQVGGANRLPGEAALVGVEALAGDSEAARARLATLPRLFVDPAHPTFREGLFAASAAVSLRNDGRALDILESVQPRGAELWSGLRLSVFDPLREQPRFQTLVQESRPPDRWRTSDGPPLHS